MESEGDKQYDNLYLSEIKYVWTHFLHITFGNCKNFEVILLSY